MANPFFFILTLAEPNRAISIYAANYEQLLLWQLASKYVLNLNCTFDR